MKKVILLIMIAIIFTSIQTEKKINQDYKDQDFVILGFPANNYFKQEPGTNEKIAEFCRINYGVTFPMFSKISVIGKNLHPHYEYLTFKRSGHEFDGKISWNFDRSLILKDRKIINRFDSKVQPENVKIMNTIEEASRN